MNLKIPTRNPVNGLIEFIEEFQHITEKECAMILEKRRVFNYVDATLRLVSGIQNCSPGQKRDELARGLRDAAMQLAARVNNLGVANKALNADCSMVFGGKNWEELPDEVFLRVAEFDKSTGNDREPQLLRLKDRLVDLAVTFNDLSMVNIKARAESDTESLALPLENIPVVVS